MVSCAGVLSCLLIGVATVAAVVALVTHHWVEYDTSASFGIWRWCTSNDSCVTKAGNTVGNWYLAVEVAYSAYCLSLVCSIIGLLCHLCCASCLGATCVLLSVIDMVIALIICVGSVVLFGVNAHHDFSAKFEGDVHFSWSFYLAMGSGAVTFLGLLFALCDIPQTRVRAQYQPIRPTV